ncbi:hypothetical protein WMY93_017963 [Mugilogobius chulae]|uniref:EDRF1 TPR repeats region domain-containing protein n=1 Tax=Mugilogobius chulae TaxID=88201 RepID=A0AAW0NUT1_9GOBI
MAGQNSSAAKLKSLTAALDIMTETRHAFQLIHKELMEEEMEKEQAVGEAGESTDSAADDGSGLNIQEVIKLIGVFEPSFSFLLLQVIKILTTIKRKPSKDEELLKTYKNVYSKLLRAEKNGPLLERVKFYIELLNQLKAETESNDADS